MQTNIPTLGTISWVRRLMPAAVAWALGLLLVFGFAQLASAQNVTTLCTTTSLCLDNNYFVTGDYVVGGAVFSGPLVNGQASGTISIPDPLQPNSTSVPAGAEIVAAFLYWETVESNLQGAPTGRNGFFNGYPIFGTLLGNPQAPTSWSQGGCSGDSQGSKTMRAYRADVRPFLPLDLNGNLQTPNALTPGIYQVKLAGVGSNQTPFTLGASLVIIYRVLSPKVPLNSIVLYDGAAAPSNQTNSELVQPIVGFYQAAQSPVAKITHIVGNGQPNKGETVFLNGTPLLNNLYPAISNTVAFPGIYNGSWDNVTWNISGLVPPGGSTVTTSVSASGSGGGCVNWGAIIFSTTVQDRDFDGLLDMWESNQGYTDAKTGQFVALPGADPGVKDIFVEVDYLSNLDGLAGAYLHSHLPKQQALDMVGDAFATKNIKVHFDVGNVYQTALPGGPSVACGASQCDPYIVQGGSGGNAISESTTLCMDSAASKCQFPGTPAIGWKGGLLFLKDNQTVPNSNPVVPLGNFQGGRNSSYHYALFGHALGAPRSFWTSFAATLPTPPFAALTSIVNTGTSAIVTIQTPPGLFKPGDCNPANLPPACSDVNGDRVTVAGAFTQPALNGTYQFTNLSSTTVNNVTTTYFTIATTNTTATCAVAPCVADGTYVYNSSDAKCLGQIPHCVSESRLVVTHAGPTSASGQSDFPGGGDTAETFGLWPADDPSNCQADPSQSLTAQKPTYCNDQLGSVLQQAGTLMHELGHTLTLAHGGTYYNDPLNNPSVPTYDFNCKPNFLSVMSYLFQVRGFPDGGIDYSGQTLPDLSEAALNEGPGIGPANHFTRWYGPPSALDLQLGRLATLHCDGSPIIDGAKMVRVDGSLTTEPSGFSGPIDWNNNLIVPDPVASEPVAWQDVNFNGSTSISPDLQLRGFNDWNNVDLLQVSSRGNGVGFSSGAGFPPQAGGGGAGFPPQAGGGGAGFPPQAGGGGAGFPPQAGGGGAGFPPQAGGGGAAAEQDQDTACSTADPPTTLTVSPGTKSVILNWKGPGGPCQVRQYGIWRSTNGGPFTLIKTLSRVVVNGNKTTAPPTTFTDTTVKNNNTYTYFVTDTDVQGATSGASGSVSIFVK